MYIHVVLGNFYWYIVILDNIALLKYCDNIIISIVNLIVMLYHEYNIALGGDPYHFLHTHTHTHAQMMQLT